ncbi:MAG: hypothetical protein ABSA45_11860 [Verrucomicrobiota bacterium]
MPIQIRTNVPGKRARRAQLRITASPDKGFKKERRVHAAAWRKGRLCRPKPAFLDAGAKLRP